MKIHTSMHTHMNTYTFRSDVLKIGIKNSKKQNAEDMINSFPVDRGRHITLLTVEPEKWSSYLPVLFRERRKEG